MGPYKNLLIPVDFTPKNAEALDRASELAAAGGKLTLLHVIEPIEGADHPELESFFRELENTAREKMGKLADRLLGCGCNVHQEIIYGRRGPAIVQFAVEHKIDLMVLGSHRVDPQNPAASWGTLSYQVATVAPCPVLLLK